MCDAHHIVMCITAANLAGYANAWYTLRQMSQGPLAPSARDQGYPTYPDRQLRCFVDAITLLTRRKVLWFVLMFEK